MISRLAVVLLVCTAAASARADASPPDVLAQKLYPPELVMGHQKELAIDDKQRDAIVKEVQGLQSRVVELQWQMQGAVEELAHLLEPPRVDEAKALAQADKVMGLEREVKRAHLAALIRIRNLLTDEQRAKLAAIRARVESK